MKQHIILFSFFVSSISQALMQEFPVKDSTRLLVSSEEASVSLVGTASAGLKVSFDPGNESLIEMVSMPDAFGVETITIRDRVTRPKISTNTKKEVDPKNHVKIEISGKSVPAEIHLLEGHVSIQKWNQEVYAHLQKGKILAKENNNSLILHMQKGEIAVIDHEGKLILDTLQASTVVRELRGDLEAQSFMGDLTLEKMKGSLSIAANQGVVKILSGSGSLQFDLQKANLTSSQFDGRVEGQSQEGNVTINTGADPDINVKSQSGRINVSANANSGALLNLASVDGDVQVPAYLKVSRDGAARTLKGRLKGDNQKGAIFVRSQEGVITVK